MKYRKLILMSALMIASVVPTQAAVYGTLKQEMYFNVGEDYTMSREMGSGISILDEDEAHYLVKVTEDTTQLVSKQLIELPGTLTRTTAEETKVCEGPSPTSEVLLTLEKEALVLVSERQDNYYKVKVDGVVGYIYKTQLDTSLLSAFDKSPSELLGEEVVSYAKQFLGGRYVYGGNNLKTGVDCSGFVQQIMKNFNIDMERSSRSQYASNGVRIKEAQLQPGDLVYYGNNGSINHVAIYAGDGQIIHASDSRTGIKMGSLRYGKPIIGMKRVL